MTKVSVLIPVYNREKTIGRAIESILAQTFIDWELILADDGSTDNSVSVIRGYTDDRIKLIERPQNGGNAAARNTCLEHASGEFLAWLDSDDAYHPQLLEKSLGNPAWNDERVGFSWVATNRIDLQGNEHGGKCWHPSRKYDDNPYHFFYELHIGTGKGIVMRRKCVADGLRFDERLRVAVDTDFMVRLRQKWMYTFVDEVLYTTHVQPGSVRTDTRKKMEAYGIMLEKYADIINQNQTLRDRWFYKYLWLCLHNDNFAGARSALKQLKKNRRKAQFLFGIFRLLPTPAAKRVHQAIAG
jgi:glycosyltransferase involved in cell wall biosynthesis